ncbi:Translation elongation factor [Parasponia andersonii]|uniref:Translation elongation factor n=1 Tax=Parasponia andersonii TaxID=3476 RepID=A0A2P5BS04_PARAD|nr:Translation elongation factor [Parasponia andersonii]
MIHGPAKPLLPPRQRYANTLKPSKVLVFNNGGNGNHLSSVIGFFHPQPSSIAIIVSFSLSQALHTPNAQFAPDSVSAPKIPHFGFYAGIMAFSSNDIKVGTEIEIDGAPWRVLEFLHVKPGKGAAFVRTKIRNFITGNTIEKTFRAGVTIDEANVFKETKQFTYKDVSQFVFMDLTTFEEIRLNEADVGDKTKWLKEGMDCNLLLWKGKVIGLELPITVQLSVVEVDPGLKGDTAQGGSKPATLETGAIVNVPLFINTGDTIIVDTRTGQYTSRA